MESKVLDLPWVLGPLELVSVLCDTGYQAPVINLQCVSCVSAAAIQTLGLYFRIFWWRLILHSEGPKYPLHCIEKSKLQHMQMNYCTNSNVMSCVECDHWASVTAADTQCQPLQYCMTVNIVLASACPVPTTATVSPACPVYTIQTLSR